MKSNTMKKRYPGTKEAETERANASRRAAVRIDNEPDFIPGTSRIIPNYEAFKGWKPEEVLVFLNID